MKKVIVVIAQGVAATGIIVTVSLLILAGFVYFSYPHEDKPPKFDDNKMIWPSCHWDGTGAVDGTPDAHDWEVEFMIENWKTNKVLWRQWVATGLSEKEAGQLCDAYLLKETR